MSRITKFDPSGVPMIPQEKKSLAVAKLWNMENKEEQGRLIELPVAIGETIYEIFSQNYGCGIVEWQVDGYRKTDQEYSILCHYKNDRIPYTKMELAVCRLGTDLFKSKKEAEKKLEEIRNEQTDKT